MRLTLQTTDREITLNGVSVRLYTGETEDGTPCKALISTMGVPTATPQRVDCRGFILDMVA